MGTAGIDWRINERLISLIYVLLIFSLCPKYFDMTVFSVIKASEIIFK